jgi:hypothetical protein
MLICCLLFFNFEKNEIMRFISITSEVFDTRCSGIRKKFELNRGGNIGKFIDDKLKKNLHKAYDF